MALLRIDRHDVVGRQRVVVQHRDQFAATPAAPGFPTSSARPGPVPHWPSGAAARRRCNQIAVDLDRHLLAPFWKYQPRCCPPCRLKARQLCFGQLVQRARDAAALEVGRRGAHHAPVAGQLDGDETRIDHAADADAHVIALAHQVDHLVGQVERDPHFGCAPGRPAHAAPRAGARRPPAPRRSGGRSRVAPFGHHASRRVQVGQQFAAMFEVGAALFGQVRWRVVRCISFTPRRFFPAHRCAGPASRA
jgi:hypothetical protein